MAFGSVANAAPGAEAPPAPDAQAPASKPLPVVLVSFDAPLIDGTIDLVQVISIVTASEAQLRACYQRQLDEGSELRGLVAAKLVIQSDGAVAAVTAIGLDRPLEACLVEVLSKLTFPRSPDDTQSTVRYPLRFQYGPKKSDIGQSDLDKLIIRRYIKRFLSAIQKCYKDQLAQHPTLEGTVTTQFTIGPDGRTTKSTASGVDPTVSKCIASVIQIIKFPRPVGGGSATVNLPFIFHSSGNPTHGFEMRVP
ncbi:MAG TPA: AgmX/PglI C-terminal domain-containing protein [Kofleriaceae bacterium]|nr:AgmX/PglI C-terminal domain-containing protein [Kofleriaceae bacterium]